MHIQACVHCACKHSHTLAHCERQSGDLWTRELIASQAAQLQSEAREAPPCLLRSKGSFFKALFGFRTPQQLNSTQKSLFSPFLHPLFSLFTFSDSAAFWQLIRSLCTKGNDVLNWIIGSFLQMSAHPPTQPQTLNSPSGIGFLVRFQNPQSGWAWKRNLGSLPQFE